MTKLYFENIQEGFVQELCHTVTARDIQQFCELTGDVNPLHLDKGFARQAGFGKPVVYGMLSASFISTVIGTLLPGPGALWLSQTLEFVHQVYENDEIRVVARVRKKSVATRILVLETLIYNQKGQEIIRGEAKVQMLFLPEGGKCMDTDFKQNNGRVVLVIGGAGGIGGAVVRLLAQQGYKVVVNYRSNKEAADTLVQEITLAKGCVMAVKADITQPQEVRAMFDAIRQNFGSVEGLVYAASGPIDLKPFSEMEWEAVQRHFDVQVKGAFLSSRMALSDMLVKGGGAIVVIGTIAIDNIPPSQQAAYVSAKSALVSLAKSMAVEYGPKNVRVNIVSPGMTQTVMVGELSEKSKEVTRMQTPLRRLALPEDIAGAVAFLLSPAACHITGENLRVCGGMVML
jgi:3-oxoacyl-[acyl-carrier protein] reductase